MDFKFELIFKAIGWEDAWEIDESGCKLLTIEFLCTLQTTDSEVSFRFFGKEFSFPWKNFSELLGFPTQCTIDVDSAIQDFDRNKFWREISKEIVCYRPRTNDIHHPTLRFMHKWLGFSLFPRNDFRTVRNDELKLLYAMVKRKKVSPIKFMMAQWAEILGLKGDVGCTSLATHIARNLGLLANASIACIDSPQWIID